MKMTDLLPCAVCGGAMRLGTQRISVNRKRGVIHCIEHMLPKGCRANEGLCVVMLKPYPKRDEDKDSFKLIQQWNAAQEMRTEMQADAKAKLQALLNRFVNHPDGYVSISAEECAILERALQLISDLEAKLRVAGRAADAGDLAAVRGALGGGRPPEIDGAKTDG
jgi:recombinational DNA repair protein (RecF pathway)